LFFKNKIFFRLDDEMLKRYDTQMVFKNNCDYRKEFKKIIDDSNIEKKKMKKIK